MTFRRAVLVFLATLGTVVAVDQAVKAAVRSRIPAGASIPVIDGVLHVTHVRNTGAAFGMFPGSQNILLVFAVMVLTGIAIHMWVVRSTDPRVFLPMGLLAGGSAGNLIDRIVSGRVTDFLDVRIWPVFNVADSCILIGVTLLAWRLLMTETSAKDSPEESPAPASSEPEPGS